MVARFIISILHSLVLGLLAYFFTRIKQTHILTTAFVCSFYVIFGFIFKLLLIKTGIASAVSFALLFTLVYGFSATVEIHQLRQQLSNGRAIATGCCMQFILLPLLGFICVKAFALPPCAGVILLVITSSPGGANSNMYCALFNAELALSVSMTVVSSMLAIVMLPLNLYIYTNLAYEADVIQSLDWESFFLLLGIVISAIMFGVLTTLFGNYTNTSIWVHKIAHWLGSISGLILMLLSIFVNSDSGKHDDINGTSSSSIWKQDLSFYVACTLPPILGIFLAFFWSTKAKLDKPECMAVAIEACHQNIAIAGSLALAMFSSTPSASTSTDYSTFSDRSYGGDYNSLNHNYLGNSSMQDDYYFSTSSSISLERYVKSNSSIAVYEPLNELEVATGVVLLYGITEAVAIVVFSLICGKMSWSKAPAAENLCVILMSNYEVSESHEECKQGSTIRAVNHDDGVDYEKGEQCLDVTVSSSSSSLPSKDQHHLYDAVIDSTISLKDLCFLENDENKTFTLTPVSVT